MRTRQQAKKDRRELLRDIERDHRRKMREKLVALREQIRQARLARDQRLQEAAAQCRAKRIAVREAARARRLAALAELRAAYRAERTAARDACSARKQEVRQSGRSSIATTRAELQAERKYQQDLRRIEAGNREARRLARGGGMKNDSKRTAERRGESDDEVRQNIPAELLTLFEKVKRSIKGGARKSRTEAFLQYAEEHPREILEAIEDKTEALVRDLERQRREAEREARRRRPSAPAAYAEVPF